VLLVSRVYLETILRVRCLQIIIILLEFGLALVPEYFLLLGIGVFAGEIIFEQAAKWVVLFVLSTGF
jgi:hypothetical protein